MIRPPNHANPLTRPMRRVLFHLLKGGTLVQVFNRRPGGDRRAYRPDPQRWYFTLFPNLGEGGPRAFCINKPIRKAYMVRREKVEALIAKGYLRSTETWRERGTAEHEGRKASRADLVLPAAEEIIAVTDENGAIRRRPIPPPIRPKHPKKQNNLKKQLQGILERSRHGRHDEPPHSREAE